MSESGHWYDNEGNACHTVLKADGKGHTPTTIAHARKLKLRPSVTTITSCIGKGSLVDWMCNEVGVAAYSNPPQDGESAQDYARRLVRLSKRQVEDAASLGTNVHACIEAALNGQEWDRSYSVYVLPVLQWIKDNHIEVIESEHRFSSQYGYGGTIDVTANRKNSGFILDFKTRKTKAGEKVKPYETQPMQIAAYHRARFGDLFNMAGANLYISTTEPGRIDAVFYDQTDLSAALDAFDATFDLWCYIKEYDPR
jgi:hypothetical protein